MYFPSDYRLSPSINASMDRQTHTRQNHTNQKTPGLTNPRPDIPLDPRTEKVPYRVAWTHLKQNKQINKFKQ